MATFLAENFPQAPLGLPAAALRPLLRTVVDARVSGGAIDDALIGKTVRRAGATLLTRDKRAIPAHERIMVRYGLIG